ncbi:NUDIX domain-containing protein [Actinokineospora cianjurensis]|uniref:ADP-ribose pyrophosphatase YjhB (NUDIX family) n=1 Tax=Actinokineospora cianjurensis TaxID=585224 RepID=A0A421AW84_9PSEU|nr:NUDIX hydrolase [Actinokineospora cianjurensis]RLK54193.1 ADP-ribose pyrophosphatase YjhB (NUDIX family) [Actinokineospora cianjurensis]
MRTAEEPPGWQRVDSVVEHTNPWFSVYSDHAIRPDGSAGRYFHVRSTGSVTLLATDAEQRILFTRQWIYTHGSRQWRLPSGAIDPGDVDAKAAARRELREETGLRAGSLTVLNVLHGCDSFTNHVDHLFHATDLSEGTADLEGGEADLRLAWIPFDEAVKMARDGDVPHGPSAFAVLALAAKRWDCP